MRDLHHNIAVETLVAGATVTGSDEEVTDIDLGGFDSCEFLIQSAVSEDAAPDFRIWIEHSDDGETYEACEVTDLIGVEAMDGTTPKQIADAAAIFDDGSNGSGDIGSADGEAKQYRFGYRGGKRYAQLTIHSEGTNSSGTVFSAFAIKGHPHLAPTV